MALGPSDMRRTTKPAAPPRLRRVAAHMCANDSGSKSNTYGHKIDGLDDVGAVGLPHTLDDFMLARALASWH